MDEQQQYLNPLLEKAKHYTKNQVVGRPSIPITHDQVELALAWVAGTVSLKGVAEALGMASQGSNVYLFLAKALREYVLTLNKAANTPNA